MTLCGAAQCVRSEASRKAESLGEHICPEKPEALSQHTACFSHAISVSQCPLRVRWHAGPAYSWSCCSMNGGMTGLQAALMASRGQAPTSSEGDASQPQLALMDQYW